MTLIGWLQIGLLFLVVAAAGEAARPLHGARLFRRAHVPLARARTRRARLLRRRRRRSDRRAGLARLYARHARLLDGGLRRALRDPAPARLSAAQPARLRRHVAATSPSTRRSASSPTPTGSPMAARRRMSHFSQMAGLTVQNFALGRDRHRHGAGADARLCPLRRADRRQFLGRSDPRHALRAAAAVDHRRARLRRDGPAADARRFGRLRRRSKARSRPSRSGPSPARRRSSSSAPMAAASSTSMPRIRSRTRRRCRTISTSSPCSASRRRWSTPSARWSATAARAGPSSPRPASCSSSASASIYWAETHGNPILTALGVDPALGNMEGKEVRFGQAMTAALCGGHHRPLRRRRQRHARLLHRRSAVWCRCS